MRRWVTMLCLVTLVSVGACGGDGGGGGSDGRQVCGACIADADCEDGLFCSDCDTAPDGDGPCPSSSEPFRCVEEFEIAQCEDGNY